MSARVDKERRILTLAAEVAEASDRDVPTLLLGLSDILSESSPTASGDIAQWKKDIWDYDLLEVLLLVLKQNYEYISGKWATAAKLATILSTCCVGIEPSESREFYGVCLPNASENLLILARKLQVKATDEASESAKRELLNYYYTVLEAITALLGAHSFLAVHVIKSSWMLQLLITDDVRAGLAAIRLLQNALHANAHVFQQLDEKVIQSICDELTYKLTVSDDINIGSAATRLLCSICTAHRRLGPSLGVRYRGLRPLLSKWTGKGFGQDLRVLLGLLETGAAKQTVSERHVASAIVIQAHWRSYRARRQLERASSAVTALQRVFRRRKARELRQKEEHQQQSDLQHKLLVARKQAMRDTRQKRLQILSVLPAGEIAKHIRSEQEASALCIQRAWRGYSVRKQLASKKLHIRRLRAAIVLQRQFRRVLSKRKAKQAKELPMWRTIKGLTDEKRVQLQKLIVERRETYPPRSRSRPEQEELHGQAQDALGRWCSRASTFHRQQQHREALLAELETDAELLLGAPKLGEISKTDAELFVTRCVPVAAKARLDHTEEMRLLRQPWWKKLGDRYQDEKLAEDQDVY